jgi:hypothetical protein
MSPVVTLGVDPDLLLRVLEQLRSKCPPGQGADPAGLVGVLLERWLIDEEDGYRDPPPEAGGYRWKELLLPEGTQLREPGGYTATVRRGRLMLGNAATSPNRLAWGSKGTTHNAWKALYLKFPGTNRWQNAHQLRLERQRAAAVAQARARVEAAKAGDDGAVPFDD